MTRDTQARLIILAVETICQGLVNIHEFWAVPIELAIALYLLHNQLGVAFVAPAIIAMLSMAVILVMAKYTGNAQKIWIQGIQTRVDTTAGMLASMKVSYLKFYIPQY
jgi:ATP-binding cassette subfamily C (CFTR/MRP) protein 1